MCSIGGPPDFDLDIENSSSRSINVRSATAISGVQAKSPCVRSVAPKKSRSIKSGKD